MTRHPAGRHPNILAVVQDGRLAFQALLLAGSLRASAPGFRGRLILAEPRAEGAWAGHRVALAAPIRAALSDLGAEILPFTAHHFGAAWPQGNKIEALSLLPPGEPFLFLDTDTLVLGPLETVPFDFARPSASMRREGSWPEPPLYGPGYGAIWRSLYDRFGLDFERSLDRTQPDEHWERYLYFNAGWFFAADPAEFQRLFLAWALAVRDDPGEALACQSLFPWLDQIVLPLVIHALGGGRPGPDLAGLDGAVTCHYRNLPLLYARESDRAVAVLEEVAGARDLRRLLRDWRPARELIFQNRGRRKIRPMFQTGLPALEQPLRQRLKKAGFWITD